MRTIIIIIVFTIVSLECVTSKHAPLATPTRAKDPPKVYISKWILADDDLDPRYYPDDVFLANYAAHFVDWAHRDKPGTYPAEIIEKDNNTFVILQGVQAVAISCEAPYPIRWITDDKNFDRVSFANSHNRRGSNMRTAENVSDPTTYRYRSNLEFLLQTETNGGYYICESVEEPTIDFRRIYIFFEGSRLIYFPEIELNHVMVVGWDGHQENLVLPCYTSLPDLPVVLSKRTLQLDPALDVTDDYVQIEVDNDPNIHFDSKEGFIITNISSSSSSTNDNDTVLGVYKCQANDTDVSEQSLIIHVVEAHELEGRLSSEFMHENTSFTISDEGNIRTVHCCSSTSKVPNLITISCSDPMTCDMQHSELWNFHLISNHFFHSYEYVSNPNGTCVKDKIFPHEIMIAGCFGDDISLTRTLYSSQYILTSDHTIYTVYNGWKKIVPQDMISVKQIFDLQPYNLDPFDNYYLHRRIRDERTNITIYSGQAMSALCQPSSIYFAVGSHWQLKWKNGSVTPFKNFEFPKQERKVYGIDVNSFILVNFTAHEDMVTLSCVSPVWNSSQWIEKSIALNITPATITSLKCTADTQSSLNWALGSSNMGLKCLVKGDPLPEMMMMKNGKLLHDESGYEVTTKARKNKILMSLKVSTVFHDAQGLYLIQAKNSAGTMEASFMVFVYEPVNWTVIGITSFTLVAAILGLTVLIWKWRHQKATLSRLNVSYVNKVNGVEGSV